MKESVTHFSVLFKGVRRTLSTRSLYLGLKAFPVVNFRDMLTADGMSLSNWANSFVSVNRWNFAAELMEKTLANREFKAAAVTTTTTTTTHSNR